MLNAKSERAGLEREDAETMNTGLAIGFWKV